MTQVVSKWQSFVLRQSGVFCNVSKPRMSPQLKSVHAELRIYLACVLRCLAIATKPHALFRHCFAFCGLYYQYRKLHIAIVLILH